MSHQLTEDEARSRAAAVNEHLIPQTQTQLVPTRRQGSFWFLVLMNVPRPSAGSILPHMLNGAPDIVALERRFGIELGPQPRTLVQYHREMNAALPRGPVKGKDR